MMMQFDKNSTFKPKRNFAKGSKMFELHKQAKGTLGTVDLRRAVALPPGEDLNDWLAVNTVDFFNQVNVLYGSIAAFCTPKSCAVMNAGPTVEYWWADEKTKKTIRLSAPEYIDRLMGWIQHFLDDPAVFPTAMDTPFPKNFLTVTRNIFKRLFRVYAHVYYTHFQKILSLNLETQLNTCFKHYYYFIKEFKLVESKELLPLANLIENLTGDKIGA
eukprot:TRINITY_DN2641_c0_g1_i1.p2 TRINITY_DN2641_c0_g1~~TRINITY_DN2641_c0_g1_i1.p2  ORF type:complete len:224 (-),score=85.66 TRINITY_DN2641_c0_g1_i1:554-1201(-)